MEGNYLKQEPTATLQNYSQLKTGKTLAIEA